MTMCCDFVHLLYCPCLIYKNRPFLFSRDPKTNNNEAYGAVRYAGESDGVYEIIPLQIRPPLPIPHPTPGESNNNYV